MKQCDDAADAPNGQLRAYGPVQRRSASDTLTPRIAPIILEGGLANLEELLQPAIEHRRMRAKFFAEVGNWSLLDQVPAQDGDFFFRSEVLTL